MRLRAGERLECVPALALGQPAEAAGGPGRPALDLEEAPRRDAVERELAATCEGCEAERQACEHEAAARAHAQWYVGRGVTESRRPGNEGGRSGDLPVRRSIGPERGVDRDQRFEAELLPQLRPLFGAAYRMTGNAHDAEDLVQETFLRAYRALDRFQAGSNARAWLLTILQRVRTDAFRRRQRRPQTVELTDDGPQLAVPPAQNALASGYEDLERALQALPEAFRTAVVLRDVQDLSYAEIAEALGVPVGTVMSRIHRGRALLREALGPKGSA